MQLIGNSLKFTESGDVSIEVKQVKNKRDTVIISVKDSGIGMTVDE